MLNIEEVKRKNPKASEELENLRETFDTLRLLREAGLIRGDYFQPAPMGRRSLEDLKPKRTMRDLLKKTDNA